MLTLKVESALIYDSVLLLAKALHELDRSVDVSVPSLSCEGTETWKGGHSLIDFMKRVRIIRM